MLHRTGQTWSVGSYELQPIFNLYFIYLASWVLCFTTIHHCWFGLLRLLDRCFVKCLYHFTKLKRSEKISIFSLFWGQVNFLYVYNFFFVLTRYFCSTITFKRWFIWLSYSGCRRSINIVAQFFSYQRYGSMIRQSKGDTSSNQRKLLCYVLIISSQILCWKCVYFHCMYILPLIFPCNT
jgi:hypothetical protein